MTFCNHFASISFPRQLVCGKFYHSKLPPSQDFAQDKHVLHILRTHRRKTGVSIGFEHSCSRAHVFARIFRLSYFRRSSEHVEGCLCTQSDSSRFEFTMAGIGESQHHAPARRFSGQHLHQDPTQDACVRFSYAARPSPPGIFAFLYFGSFSSYRKRSFMRDELRTGSASIATSGDPIAARHISSFTSHRLQRTLSWPFDLFRVLAECPSDRHDKRQPMGPLVVRSPSCTCVSPSFRPLRSLLPFACEALEKEAREARVRVDVQARPKKWRHASSFSDQKTAVHTVFLEDSREGERERMGSPWEGAANPRWRKGGHSRRHEGGGGNCPGGMPPFWSYGGEIPGRLKLPPETRLPLRLTRKLTRRPLLGPPLFLRS